VDKDYTDLELCIEYVIGSKYAELLIFGAIGLRADHSYVNVQLLTKCLENNIQAKIIDSLNIIQLINGDTSLHAKKGQLISIIPLTSTVSNISTKGLKYVLHNEDLRIGSSRGVSNVFLGDDASISFNDGLLLVILCRDK
jgi:thiamine pyrophosphokinase